MNIIRKFLYTSRYYCNTHSLSLPDDLAIALKSIADLSTASAEYSRALMEALHNYADGSMGMVEARNDFIQSMASSFADAFDAGYADGGGDPDNIIAAASAWLGDREDQERQNILDLFRTLKEQMGQDPPVDIGAWISDRSAGYTGTINDVYNMGAIFGKQGEALTFDGEDGKESCSTCQRLKGETHPASWWIENDLIPTQGNDNFECGGWNCQHGLKDLDGNWVTLNPYNFKMSVKADKPEVPPQLADSPNDANAGWLQDNSPRISEFMTGTDPDGKPMISYLVDGVVVRTNIWQDFTAGGNHSRYPWIPEREYWLDVSNASENESAAEACYDLIHETVEDRKMAGSHKDEVYSNAHEYFANPAEYKARHGEDPKAMLKELGWEVDNV